MQLGVELDCEFDFEDTEILYARYPIGGYYKRHSDSHTISRGISLRDTERALSFILYLNQNEWSPEDGGELRMYGLESLPWINHVDVSPLPGTLLLFKSPDFAHEVMKTNVIRRAVVGWFRVRTKPALVSYFASLDK
jgi:SM-20-related protein